MLTSVSLAILKGVMAGYDQKSNVVLSDSKERVYSMDEGVEEIPLGLYLVKGDQMYALSTFIFFSLITLSLNENRVLIGEIDEPLDQSVDLSTIRADPLPAIRY